MNHQILIFIFISLFVGGCSQQPQLTRLSKHAVLLAFGDSLTYGSGAERGTDYPSLLAQMTKLKVINAGIPGEISKDGLKRLPRLLDEHNPELMILIHGGNDMLRKLDQESIRAHLGSMIQIAKRKGISVIMLGVPTPSALFLESADFYATLAREYEIVIDTETLPTILADKTLKSDLIHPNEEGYQLIAEAVHQLLKDNGAL